MTSDIVEKLIRWAEAQDPVRSVLVTSTRAIPNASIDAYSDYDVILVIKDVQAWVAETNWITTFGDVLVAYWDPVRINEATGGQEVNSVIYYSSGLKIDFTLWSVEAFAANTADAEASRELDAGYLVWLDKDGLTSELLAPTYTAYIPKRPNEAAFHRLTNDFLVGVPYVAKSLLRGHLLPAKWVLDFDMRFNYLLPLLEWRAECEHDWSVTVGALGKGLQSYLPAKIWADVLATFADSDPQRNWESLFDMVNLFGRVAADVADYLGYQYPAEFVERVRNHAQAMRDGVFAQGPIAGA